jgi:hypothetical protein
MHFRKHMNIPQASVQLASRRAPPHRLPKVPAIKSKLPRPLPAAARRRAAHSVVYIDWKQRNRVEKFLARLRRSALLLLLLGATTCVGWATTPNTGSTFPNTHPLTLKVLQRAGPPTTALSPGSQGQSNLPAPAVNEADEETSGADDNSLGFLRIVSPKKEFFVGELVPVQLQAFFRAGVELRVDGLPKLNSDAFAMNKLGEQPERSQKLIGDVPYTVFTWPTALTALKAGDYETSVEIPTTVTVRQRAEQPRAKRNNPFGDPFFDDFFNDPFFDNFFGTATEKQVALNSRPAAVKILALPREGRPTSFTGAVGNFDIAGEVTPTETAIGDPVTLKLKVSGTGNFDRVTIPVVEKNDAWKTYKPTAKFEPQDSAGHTGVKTFEQALVPVRGGKLEIPARAFSFFDPDKRQYVTHDTTALSIEVSGRQTASATVPPASAVFEAKATPPPHARRPTLDNLTATLLNLKLAACALVPVLFLVAAYGFVRRRRHLACDPERLRNESTRAAMQAQLDIMENAVKQGAAADFLTAARTAFQIRLGLRWNLPPRTITLAEINARMNGEAEDLRFIFELADEAAYTGRAFPAADLQNWSERVATELKKL